MKILFNCLNFEKGGAQRVVSILANNFCQKEKVYILLSYNQDIKYKLDKKIKIINIEKKKKKRSKISKRISQISLIKLRKMAKSIKEINPDVIISFLPEPSLKLMFIKRFSKVIRNIPTIISIRNNPEQEYKSKLIYLLMKNLYKDVNKLVLQTPDALKYFAKILNKDKLIVIPNPIAPEFIVNRPYDKIRTKEIVTVGRLVPQKNYELLIRVFAKVSVKFPEYKLLIYGRGYLESRLKKMVNELKLENKVIFKGEVANIQEEIYKSSLFVLTSNYEGMPNALMEAMALGLPCIATDCPCGGPKQLITNNTNGLLVPVNDEEALEKAIVNLLKDEVLAFKLGQQAFLSSHNYEPKKICTLWEKEIFKIVEKSVDN